MNTRDLFHVEYYDSGVWSRTYWMGHRVEKFTTDLMAYQEIIFEVQPDLIIECGTNFGGSAMFFGDMCRLVGKGRVVSIDVSAADTPYHSRVEYIKGDSSDPKMVLKVKPDGVVMVVLDSDHSFSHVINELDLWSPYVSKESYLVVEDTNVNGNPVCHNFGDGPGEAVKSWLPRHPEFVVDSTREKFLITTNPGGYLKRVLK